MLVFNHKTLEAKKTLQLAKSNFVSVPDVQEAVNELVRAGFGIESMRRKLFVCGFKKEEIEIFVEAAYP